MGDGKDPLANLLLDAEEVDRARLAAALQEILGVDTKSGRVVFKPGFNRLTARQKLLAYLLGRKVALLLGKNENESVTVKEIQADTGLPKGTVAPKLRELLELRLLSQTKSGEYYVGPQQVTLAIEELKKEKQNEQ